MTRLALVPLALLAGCCFGFGAPCDPETYAAHCTEHAFVLCDEHASRGFDFGAQVLELECDPGEVCLDRGGGQGGCVLSPPTPCDSATHAGDCRDGREVVCTSPSSFLTETYEIAGPPCAP